MAVTLINSAACTLEGWGCGEHCPHSRRSGTFIEISNLNSKERRQSRRHFSAGEWNERMVNGCQQQAIPISGRAQYNLQKPRLAASSQAQAICRKQFIFAGRLQGLTANNAKRHCDLSKAPGDFTIDSDMPPQAKFICYSGNISVSG